jgi:opacity protein-like surface antigen
MYKHLTALAALTAGTCLAASVQAKDLTGWFVNAGAGSAHYHASTDLLGSGSNSGTAFAVNAGWRSQFIGVEAGYVDLGSVKAHDSYGDHAKLSGDGWTLGVNGHFNPTKQWYISARGGAFMWKLHGSASLTDGTDTYRYRGSKQSLGWYAGVGTGFDINWHWSVGAHFDYYKISDKRFAGIDTGNYDIGTRVYSIRAEYRF